MGSLTRKGAEEVSQCSQGKGTDESGNQCQTLVETLGLKMALKRCWVEAHRATREAVSVI